MSGRCFVFPCIYHGGDIPSRVELPEDLTAADIVICPGCEGEADDEPVGTSRPPAAETP